MRADVRHLRRARRIAARPHRPSSCERLEADGEEVLGRASRVAPTLGEQIRELVLHGGTSTPWAEALLFAAARAQHVERGDPACARARRVRRLRPLRRLLGRVSGRRARARARPGARAQPAAVGGLLPDRTFLLLLDPAEVSGARGRRARPDRARGRGVPPRASPPATASSRSGFPSESSSSTATRPPTSSRRRCMERFASVPEQPEAKRLLAAALGRRAGARLPLARACRESGSGRPRSRSRPRCSATRGGSRRGRIPTSTCSSRSAR